MSSRKKISPKVRQMVYEKCNHRCAYCGCELDYKDMQVDHIESVYKHDFEKYRFGNAKLTEEELNSIENYMPACRACNFYKSTFSLEKFRENLTTKLYENLRKNFNYKLMCKYGIIKEDIKPIEFDFGKQRCERYIKRFNQKTECLLDDMLKWKDVLDTVREEMGIDLSIRQND